MKTFLSIVAASALLVIAGGTPVSHAQVTDSVEADIPFGFTVKNTSLPAGHYTIKRIISTEPGIMEIFGDDYKHPLLIMVDSAQVLTGPQKTELIFERIGGDQYFLSQIFEAGDNIGVAIPKSRSERRLEKENVGTKVQSVTVFGQNGLNANR